MLPTWILGRWRLIMEIAALVILLMWIAGLTIQRNHARNERDALQVFKTEAEALGRLAEAKAKQENANREGVTDNVDKTSKPRRAVLLKRLSDADSRPGQVSRPPTDQKGVAGAAPESKSCSALEARAALDAEALLTWQEWAREQGFPVR
jgi:hypothetical protein